MRDQKRLRLACACMQSGQSLCESLENSMTVKLLTEHNLEFLSLKAGCTGWSESTLDKIVLLEITCRRLNMMTILFTYGDLHKNDGCMILC